MDKQYDNTNRGAFFRNDRKTAPNQPDHKGSINVDGKEYWMSVWDKDGKSGPYGSVALTPKEARAGASDRPSATVTSLDDAVPF